MKNLTGHTGVLKIIGRAASSESGNPRFLLCVDGWMCRTAPDSALAYGIQNLDGKLVRAAIGTHYGYATLASVAAV